MRIAVTGMNGQVATALQARGAAAGTTILPLARPAFDLLAHETIDGHLARLAPDVLVSAAAYTAVDLAESQADEARAINAVAPGALARASAKLGIPVLHLSTDYVFDGTKPTPYREDDPTGPTGVYGATKLAGEQAVAAGNPRHVILRTAWVYADTGKNFVLTMLRLAGANPAVRVVSDQFGCPTYAVDIADALLAIAAGVIAAPAGDPRFGVFHLAGAGDTSWAGFAAAIFAEARRQKLPDARVIPIASSDYPTPARRPANSRLDCGRLAEIHGVSLPAWHDGLARCIAAIATPSSNR